MDKMFFGNLKVGDRFYAVNVVSGTVTQKGEPYAKTEVCSLYRRPTNAILKRGRKGPACVWFDDADEVVLVESPTT